MEKSKCLGWLAMAAALLLVDSGAVAATDEPRGEVGALLGAGLPDGAITGDDDLQDAAPAIGIRGLRRFNEVIGWFADATYASFDSNLGGDADVLSVRTGPEFMFRPSRSGWRWFLDLGGGVMVLDLPNPVGFDRGFVSAGFGARKQLSGANIFRVELRGDRTLDEEGLFGADVFNAYLLASWSWGLGRLPIDDDGDGVRNRFDKCPETPAGATVDQRGCPKDSDGDGVFDGLDSCPDTPKGWPVNASGCPLDSDGDGVADGGDDCPNTPRGVKVDARGCPLDSDGDGVFDGLDSCPDTPRGWPVNASGCPLDGDRDGVPDGADKCPDTPAGARVDRDGCPIPEPTKAAPLFEPGKRTLVLEGVNFALDSAALTPSSIAILDRVVASLKDWPEVRVEIGGHTDSSGSDGYNVKLSQRRAQAVRDYLTAQGVAAARLTAKGLGERQPLADNATEAGRARNRRVELTRLD